MVKPTERCINCRKYLSPSVDYERFCQSCFQDIKNLITVLKVDHITFNMMLADLSRDVVQGDKQAAITKMGILKDILVKHLINEDLSLYSFLILLRNSMEINKPREISLFMEGGGGIFYSKKILVDKEIKRFAVVTKLVHRWISQYGRDTEGMFIENNIHEFCKEIKERIDYEEEVLFKELLAIDG